MKILILGSKGLLGEALQKIFFGHELIVYDREELDVTDFLALRNEITRLHPEILINCVAWNDVDGAEEERDRGKVGVLDRAVLLNARVPEELSRITNSLGTLFITYSTDHVFDGENSVGYNENHAPNPVNAYGRSKFLGEAAVRQAADKFYLIRTSRLYGQKPQSTAAKLSFVLMMVGLVKSNKELKIVNEEPGAFTYVKDLAEATKKLIEEKFAYGIYHLTNDGSVTWYECAKEIFSAYGGSAFGVDYSIGAMKLIPVSRAEFPRAAKMPKYSIMLNTKFPSMRNWKIALHEFLEELKK